MKKLAALADYASRGIRVFPLHGIDIRLCTCGNRDCRSQGKHPLHNGWQDEATSDIGKIRNLFVDPRCNIGVATGKTSGVIVVDLDKKSGGLETWSQLERAHGRIDTAWSKTQSDGRHIWLKAPEIAIRSTVGVLPGIDIRAEGGLVVAPPSRGIFGEYEWITDLDEISEAPPWLLEILTARTKRVFDVSNIQCLHRNDTLTSVSGYLRRHGAGIEELYDILLILNRKCEQPLSDSELRKIAASIAAYPVEEIEERRSNFDLLTGPELLTMKIEELGWSIKNLLPSRGFSIIGGAPNSYKTWLALSIALVCQAPGAHNSAFIKLLEQPRRVLYVDNEGGDSLIRRIQLLAKGLKVPMTRNFCLLRGVDLATATQREKFGLDIRAGGFDLVFFDTMSSIFQLREDKMDGWQAALEWFAALNRTGVQPVALHHFRKPGQYEKEPESHWLSGWFGLVRTVDWIIATVKLDATLVKVKNLKARDLAQPGLIYLDMVFGDDSAALVPGMAPANDSQKGLPYRPTA